MEIDSRTSRKLHDEHMTVKALLEKLAAKLSGIQPGQLPEPGDAALSGLLADLVAVVETELTAHFKFEEEALFPLLESAGAADLTGLLDEEHDVILPLAYKLCELARSFRRDGYASGPWDQFRRGAMELVERLTGHIDKEEMALIPMLDTLLDAAQDDELMMTYSAMQ